MEAANDFYVFKGFRGEGNPPEVEPNDDAASAQSLTLMTSATIEGARNVFIRADLGEADIDMFGVDVRDGEELNVFCGSASGGSGVEGLQVRVLDSAGAPLMPPITAFETVADGLSINGAALAAGDYILEFTKSAQSATVTGSWVNCGIVTAPPTMP